jgi:predicted alpha/beta hydrolase
MAARALEGLKPLDEVSLTADDGTRLLAYRVLEGPGAPVVLVPGAFCNRTFWMGTRGRGFALALAERGFDPWVLEPRGHGASERKSRGRPWRFDDLARGDVPAVARAAASGGRRLFLVGHSAGGAALLAALAFDRALAGSVAGIAVVATPAPKLGLRRAALARLGRDLATAIGRFPARILRFGPEDEPGGIFAQWMRWNLDGRWVGRDGFDYTARLPDLTMPALFVAGAGDRTFAPPELCRELLAATRSADPEFLLCGKKSGFSRDFGHVDVLASTAAHREVWPKIIAWLEKRASWPG